MKLNTKSNLLEVQKMLKNVQFRVNTFNLVAMITGVTNYLCRVLNVQFIASTFNILCMFMVEAKSMTLQNHVS